MFKLLLVVLAVLAVAASQYVASYGYPYAYNGLYRSGAVGYSGYAYPSAGYRSGYYSAGYY